MLALPGTGCLAAVAERCGVSGLSMAEAAEARALIAGAGWVEPLPPVSWLPRLAELPLDKWPVLCPPAGRVLLRSCSLGAAVLEGGAGGSPSLSESCSMELICKSIMSCTSL